MKVIIYKGEHYGTPMIISPHLGIYSKKWMVKLDKNCYYKFDGEDDKDWNKLCGWTTDILGRNSLRIGWRPVDNNTYELVAYVHKDGKRYTVKGENWKLGKYKFDDWVEVSITHEDNSAIFTANNPNGFRKTVLVYYDKCACMGYMSNVYFGGNRTCPHDMTIEIVEL